MTVAAKHFRYKMATKEEYKLYIYRGMSPGQKYFSFTAHSIQDESRFRAQLNQQYESKYRPVVIMRK